MFEVAEHWLGLGEASRRLGVHDNTLRRWADRGLITSRRTPGGHRRFLVARPEADRTGPTPSSAPPVWQVERLEPAQRQALAKVGRRLADLLQASLCGNAPAGTEVAHQIGRAYAHRARSIGLSLSEAMAAFVHYRALMLQDLVSKARGIAHLAAYESVVGAVLIGLAQGYESCLPDADHGPHGSFAAADGALRRKAAQPAADDFPPRPPRRDP